MTRRARAIVTAALLAFAGCATPIPPSGGPPDQIPPEIAEVSPEHGAVNVDAESVRITFSEYVEASSLAEAFSISPAFERPVEFDWSGRSVVIRFPEPLRENTTYVLTIDTNLLDIHRVAIKTPITYAFSTGPTISAGRLSGRVVDDEAGEPVAGIDVLAYALSDSTAPDSLPARPAYRTQTAEAGTFAFEYLTERYYYVAAVGDANRNLHPDPQEAFAAPPAPALFADTTSGAAIEPDWIFATVDTTAPSPIRAQSSARSRHTLRFTEPVQFLERDPSQWTLSDSAGGNQVDIQSLYMTSSEPREVHVLTPDLESRTYVLTAAGLADSSGNAVEPVPVYFTPASGDDTLRTRFVQFLPARTAPAAATPAADVTSLPRDVEPGIRFTRPITQEQLADAVTVTDSLGVQRAFVAVTESGTDYDILTEPRLQPGITVNVAVDAAQLSGPDTTYVRSYRRMSPDETGEIGGVVRPTGPDSTFAVPVVVQIIPVEVETVVPRYTTTAGPSGSFLVSDLPAGTYRLRAFADTDSSGTWDPGLLIPYEPAEGIAWRTEPLRVRSRWETTLPDTLRINVNELP